MNLLNKLKNDKISARRVQLRKQLWPDLNDEQFWHRKKNVGFTTIPRTLTLVMRVMDELSSGERTSQVYLDLWCRAHDEMFVALDKPPEMAFASGFSGQRAFQSWANRIDKLAELGFIRLAPGAGGKRGYAVILNPYLVVKNLREKISRELYNTLLSRAQEIGADDLNHPPPPVVLPPPPSLPFQPPPQFVVPPTPPASNSGVPLTPPPPPTDIPAAPSQGRKRRANN